MPFFTVLINAYNYGHYIEEAIQSVLDQSIPRHQFEVIVIDDGSTDNTAECVASFGDAIRYFYQENAGQAAAFNTGISHSKGKFIAFLDADDSWCAGKLEYIKNYLEANTDVDLVYHSLTQVDSLGYLLGNQPELNCDEIIRSPLASFLKGTLRVGMPTSGIICRSQTLKLLWPVPPEYMICADSYIMVSAPLVVNAIGYISKSLAYYRLHSNNNYNKFDEKSGGHTCRDNRLLLERLKLDLKSVKEISIKFDIDSSLYCKDAIFQLFALESLFVREKKGLVKALLFILQSYSHFNSISIQKRLYRFISVLFRLFFGSAVFNAISGRYIGSALHRYIHSLLNHSPKSPRLQWLSFRN